MPIDFGSVPDWIVAASAALAAFQGWKSLSAWRLEAGGRRRIELAEEILIGVYEVLDVINDIRSPFSNSAENFDRPGREGEQPDVQRHRDTYYPILRRLRESQPTFDKMRSQQFRAKAIFGQDFEEAFDDLSLIRREIYAAAITLIEDHTSSDRKENFQAYQGMRNTIWRRPTVDLITPRLDAALASIEKKLRPIISSAMP